MNGIIQKEIKEMFCVIAEASENGEREAFKSLTNNLNSLKKENYMFLIYPKKCCVCIEIQKGDENISLPKFSVALKNYVKCAFKKENQGLQQEKINKTFQDIIGDAGL